MQTGNFLNIKLENIGQIEFGEDRTLFLTECDDKNRPYKVKRVDLDTLEETSLFIDDIPTHYLDIGMTKDKKFLVISSNTKEDSEVWVMERSK